MWGTEVEGGALLTEGRKEKKLFVKPTFEVRVEGTNLGCLRRMHFMLRVSNEG